MPLKAGIIGSPVKRHKMVDEPTFNDGLVGSFVGFQGIQTSIAKKPYNL